MTAEGARRGLADLAAQMSREHPEDKYSFTARPVHEVITENAKRGLWMLLGAPGLLLLIACTNVANLLLARSGGLAASPASRWRGRCCACSSRSHR
ncbi:MAG: hypothetical protein K2Y23_03280 [Cyanobacteria bacterium]|nr:hypothetical protein [Cyanobacteriota bacterium]